MPKFRKKPVVIEAVRWTGDNLAALVAFGDGHVLPVAGEPRQLAILTLDSTAYANVGDWVLRGVKGEFYPCTNEILDATYDEVIA